MELEKHRIIENKELIENNELIENKIFLMFKFELIKYCVSPIKNLNLEKIKILCIKIKKLYLEKEFDKNIWLDLFNNIMEGENSDLIKNICITMLNKIKISNLD